LLKTRRHPGIADECPGDELMKISRTSGLSKPAPDKPAVTGFLESPTIRFSVIILVCLILLTGLQSRVLVSVVELSGGPGFVGEASAESGDGGYEKPGIHNFTNAVKDSLELQLLGVIGVASLFVYVPLAIRYKRTRKIEDALPDVLESVAENIRASKSVESSLKEVAFLRRDLIGKELQRTCNEMINTSFEDSMVAFAQRTRSKIAVRVVSLMIIGIESGASLADILEKIGRELWEVYMLKIERETKSSSNATAILWFGSVLTPAIMGFILGAFSQNPKVEVDITSLKNQLAVFMVVLGALCCVMNSIAIGNYRLLMKTPFFMFLSLLVFTFTVEVSGAFV